MSLYVPPPRANRPKLGVALAGGGFRASLFHVGVLRRMAELDLLRYVEVLSTVSGGSIVGALYVLMLKGTLDSKPDRALLREEYISLVRELEDTLVLGIRKDLRTRLFMNPFGVFNILLGWDSLSRRMGRIYDRYIYRKIVDDLRTADATLPRGNSFTRLLRPGSIPLCNVRFKAVDRNDAYWLEEHNRKVLSQNPAGSAIPNFVMNSTALNSGAPFRFSSEEIGDPRLGYFRYDEVEHLEKWKKFLDQTIQEVKANEKKDSLVALALWWLTRTEGSADEDAARQQWKLVFEKDRTDPTKLRWRAVIDSLCRTNFRRLRLLKLSACSVPAQSNRAQHLTRFSTILREVEPRLDEELVDAIENESELGREFLTFVRDLYYLRSAERMSPRLRRDFDRISLGLAVAASANFPPLFPALVHLGIYDDRFVTRLGLTDGGVYDNVGITTLVDEGCTDIIASDTGAPFDVESASPTGAWGTLSRLFPVLTDDVADHQRNRLRERWQVSCGLAGYNDKDQKINELKDSYALQGLALFGIDTFAPPGEGGLQLKRRNRLAVAGLRTDLDAFGDLEVAALVNAGYDRADRFLRVNLKELPYSAETRAQLAHVDEPHHLSDEERDQLPKVLKIGETRICRALGLCSPEAWLFTLLAITVLFWRLNFTASVEDLLKYPLNKLLNFLKEPLFWFPTLVNYLHLPGRIYSIAEWIDSRAEWLITKKFPLWLLLVGSLLVLALPWWWPSLKKWLGLETARISRFLATSRKLLRAALPMLMLFVAPVPLLITLLAMVVGWVSYIFYNRPFLRATRTQTPIVAFPRPPNIVWRAGRRKMTIASRAKSA